MLDVALQLEIAIDDYFKYYIEEEVREDKLALDELALLRDVRNFPEHLKSATKSLEGNDVALDRVLPCIDFILGNFERLKDKHVEASESIQKQMINSGWNKLNKYYTKTEESPAYIATLILNPSFK
jgi:hypothetical protein